MNKNQPQSIEELVAQKETEKYSKMSPVVEIDKQLEKESVHLAGEFYVAAELYRRNLRVSVTYGNAKKADVIAFSTEGNSFAKIEVKASRRNKGSVLVGTGTLENFPKSNHLFWVLCCIPNTGDEIGQPEFFVLTNEELLAEVGIRIEEYLAKREGLGDQSKWMWSINFADLRKSSYVSAWSKIKDFVN